MSVTFALTFCSALCWVFFDAVRKKISDQLAPSTILFLSSICQSTFFAVWVLYSPPARMTESYLLIGPFALLLGVIIKLLYLHSLARLRLSHLVPVLSLAPAVALIFSALLGQPPTSQQFIGIAILVVATLALSAPRNGEGATLAFTCAVLSGCGIVLEGLAIKAATPQLHGLLYSLSLLTCCMPFAAKAQMKGRSSVPFSQRIMLTVSASLALPLHMLALESAHPAVVDGVQRVFGVLGSLLLGHALFQERLRKRKLAACGAICLGLLFLISSDRA